MRCLAALLLLLAGTCGAVAGPRIALEEGRPVAEARADGIAIRLEMVPRLIDGLRVAVPVLTVTGPGTATLTVAGRPSGFDNPQGTAEIVEMDPAAPGPEVVLTSYTGGAHCCTAVEALHLTAAGNWTAVSFGQWDGGGPEMIEDADGDGVAELVSVDNAFLYAFDCYACSEAPLKILALRNGAVADVTAEPRFLPRHRAWLAEMEQRLVDYGGERGPGFWAGWIAAKTRVGEGAAAWAAFEAAYDPTTDEGVEACAVEAEICPESAVRILPLPQALRAFMVRMGYGLS
ncbi:hypothetical protein [Mongoliimonas terrestris]|uniref:hypothetical protein n=1 Tax=Mongoliimonas terrestris TaxID=1709001 RepID=UPI00094996E0|nr:hypothetical protein [Mongoliimonas terrestris]